MGASQLDSKVLATRIFNGHIEAQLDIIRMLDKTEGTLTKLMNQQV